MVAREQHLGNVPSAPRARAGVVRAIQQWIALLVAAAEGVLRGRAFMTQHSWKESGHRVRDQECRQLAA
jgi:hypothetical protein